MKFKIRFADQIVGFFVILSLVAVVAVIVLLGRSQRWFAKDASFKTFLPSATGLNRNMAVQYKGFSIGNVKDFRLNENDDVEVIFIIHEEYSDRVKLGSMVELSSSPIGLGSSFQFHFGRGEKLEEGSLIPPVGSAQAKKLIRQGLTTESPQPDGISAIVSQVNQLLLELNEALGPGSSTTEIGKIIGSLQKTIAGTEELPQNVNSLIKVAEDALAELKPTLTNIAELSAELNNPDGLIYTVLDTEKDVYTNLVKSLESISSILDSLDKTVAFIPSQTPQLSGLIIELRSTLKTAEDVLVGLTNNPLIRGGIPQRPESQSGAGSRDLRF